MAEGHRPVRVVEVGEGLSGAFAGLILAGLGYEVVQVRAGLHRNLSPDESAFYDRGRMLTDDPGALGSLLPRADVLIVDLHPRRMREMGLPCDEDALAARWPGLVEVAITSFGVWGPRSEFESCDLTDWAAGGLSYMTRRSVPGDETVNYSPVLPAGRQPEVLAGLAATIAVPAARRMVTDSGRSVFVDVSRQEVLLSMSHSYFPWFLHNQIVVGSPQSRVNYGWLVPASDGEVYIRTVEVSQWDRLVQWMGNPDWARRREDELPIYFGAPELVTPLLSDWSRLHTQKWLLEEAITWRVPVAPSRPLADVLRWDQLEHREAWDEIPAPAGSSRAPRIPMVGDVGLSRELDRADLDRIWTA